MHIISILQQSCASGLSIIFYCSQSELRDTLTHRKLEWLVYRNLLFTLRAPSDAPTYIENLNGLLTVHTLNTTDQCGAHSGLPQLSGVIKRKLLRLVSYSIFYFNKACSCKILMCIHNKVLPPWEITQWLKQMS